MLLSFIPSYSPACYTTPVAGAAAKAVLVTYEFGAEKENTTSMVVNSKKLKVANASIGREADRYGPSADHSVKGNQRAAVGHTA